MREQGRVMIEWTGRVMCPFHGVLSAAQEFEAGPAECGCQFVATPARHLWAVRESNPANGVASCSQQIAVGIGNDTLQSCGIPA